VTLAEPPLPENEVVPPDLRQRLIQRATGRLGQDHVVEGQSRHDGLRQAACDSVRPMVSEIARRRRIERPRTTIAGTTAVTT
jgi:hypothetical protein